MTNKEPFQKIQKHPLYKDGIKLFKFLIVGLPSFAIALLLNSYLVETLVWNKPLAYALVLILQVSINFFMCKFFVFKKSNHSTITKQFFQFLSGILFFRLADWILYYILVEIFGLYYIAIQVMNIFVFAILKFKYSQNIMEKKS
jgi:putative flippase GtrA